MISCVISKSICFYASHLIIFSHKYESMWENKKSKQSLSVTRVSPVLVENWFERQLCSLMFRMARWSPSFVFSQIDVGIRHIFVVEMIVFAPGNRRPIFAVVIVEMLLDIFRVQTSNSEMTELNINKTVETTVWQWCLWPECASFFRGIFISCTCIFH